MTDACDSEVRKINKISQVQHSERIIDVTVVAQHQVPIHSVSKEDGGGSSESVFRVVDVPVGTK